MAKAADCKSAIPGSNPGGASSLSYYHQGKLALVVLLCASYAENFVRPLYARFQVHIGLGLTTSQSHAKVPLTPSFADT